MHSPLLETLSSMPSPRPSNKEHSYSSTPDSIPSYSSSPHSRSSAPMSPHMELSAVCSSLPTNLWPNLPPPDDRKATYNAFLQSSSQAITRFASCHEAPSVPPKDKTPTADPLHDLYIATLRTSMAIDQFMPTAVASDDMDIKDDDDDDDDENEDEDQAMNKPITQRAQAASRTSDRSRASRRPPIRKHRKAQT